MKSRLQKALTNPISHAMEHRNLITRLQKTLTNPILHPTGHTIYDPGKSRPGSRAHYEEKCFFRP